MESQILDQLVRMFLPNDKLNYFVIVKIETDERDIDAMSMIIYLDERMNEDYQFSGQYESHGFMNAVLEIDFLIRDHKVLLKLHRCRWKDKQAGKVLYRKFV